jgi:phage head maturation protease
MSFGFRSVIDDWDNDDGQTIRTLIKAELFDVSPVAFPAYPATELQMRSEIYGYIPDIPESVRAHDSDIAERAQVRLDLERKKLDLYLPGVNHE